MFTGQRVSNFRDRFNVLFDEAHTTNTELGRELHVSNQTISAWKLGTRSPKLPVVNSIANYFDVSVQWLLGFDVQKKPYDPMIDGQQMLRGPVIVPDSELFLKLVHYMTQEDYIMVTDAFYRASERMKEAEGAQDAQR